VQFLSGRRILGVHIHHEVRVCGKKRHLTFRIATIGAMCVGLDELSDRETSRCFFWGDANVFAHDLILLADGTEGGTFRPLHIFSSHTKKYGLS
jgi:hypothetical protein